MRELPAKRKILFEISRKALSIVVIASLLLTSFPHTASAVTTKIRQEINIVDAYHFAASGSYATSSAHIQIDTAKYTGATYYFEVVASTTAATNASIYLKMATSSATISTITANGTSYARYRSVSFTPTAGANDYTVVLGNEAVGKGIIAARVIVLQSADPIADTQTQIEIGNEETAKTNTATGALANPKYWLYDSTKWDGSPAFFAEVTYKNIQAASSTTYSIDGTYTYIESPGVSYITVEAWGSGGGGGLAASGGGGGGGGAYARSTTTPTGSSHTLVVGNGGATEVDGADSTYDTTVVVADGGLKSLNNAAGAGGTVANSTGDVEFAGGSGGAADPTPDTGGGGGGSAGPDGGGSGGQVGQASVGGGGGNANGVAGTQANGGNGACPTGNGAAGTSAATGGNGGGGSDTSCAGGNGGAPAGGGGGGDGTGPGGTGGDGQIKLTETHGKVGIAIEEDDGSFGGWTFKAQIVASGVATATPSRVRSASFTPTTGRNYRLVASTTDATATYDIYNAKIIVDQTSPTLLEPQYLIANTGSFGGSTGLKDFDTLFDPAEWTNVDNTYIHEANGVAAGTGNVKLQSDPNGTPADITGSTITGVIEREQSSAMTMPGASATLDVNVTGTGTLNASRILAQVAPPAAAPTVATNAATNVGTISATLNGNITATGGSNATVRGFAWGTDSTLSTVIGTTTESGSFGTGAFTKNVSGLISGTTYYFRAYATNPTGTGYGSIQNFTAGTDTGLRRLIKLFEGFRIKLGSGKIIVHQRQ